MASLQSRARIEPNDDLDNVLHSFHEWMAEKAQADRNRKISSGRNDAAAERSYIPPSFGSPGPSIVPNQQAMTEEISGNEPSVGRRVFRTFIYSLAVAALVIVAWQAYRDEKTKEMISSWGSRSLSWLSSVPARKAAINQHPATAASTNSSNQSVAIAQSGSAQTGADVFREVLQQLEAAMSDLGVIRRTVEQIATKQEQMAQDIATLQAAQRDVNQKIISSLAQAAAVRAARKNVPKATHPEPVGQPASPPPVPPPPAGTPPQAQ
jgi:hypothetical protein